MRIGREGLSICLEGSQLRSSGPSKGTDVQAEGRQRKGIENADNGHLI